MVVFLRQPSQNIQYIQFLRCNGSAFNKPDSLNSSTTVPPKRKTHFFNVTWSQDKQLISLIHAVEMKNIANFVVKLQKCVKTSFHLTLSRLFSAVPRTTFDPLLELSHFYETKYKV